MKLIQDVQEMQQTVLGLKRQGKRIAFVPTMGFLHEGHASLLREGRKRGDVLVLSIFVNPTQFGINEDLASYPRNLEGDCALAESCGVDLVFVPTAVGMYPPGFQTTVALGSLTKPLCGASRPGHFNGVAVVVTKLFGIVQPDCALFGNKDFQQLAIIRQMTIDLNLAVEIIGMPIVREPDGLAMSSRNSYLSPEQRQQALCLSKAILKVRELFAGGETSVDRLLGEARMIITAVAGASVDYLELRDSTTLEPAVTATADTLFALAVKIGSTRLIDNTVLGGDL
ncbi:pantothenate synthetase [Trichlorobacter thiogenes]|uniref:Pantothenate synthetase n=1 Tax=Trichlorobacter thiogenes TaxID=115783 RepID=A0A1T4LPU4_9BACT|nr:pantoate--beta-alanine ligase [Trichlorobacter thiogenes]SJZ56715.1 pantothenate synthetase [Trichlorobacter thiogenes]